MRPDRSVSTYFQLGAGMATFGSATPVSKIVTGAMPVFVGSALRVALGALVLAPVALRDPGRIARLDRREWGWIGLIALFGMFGFSALMLWGMQMVPGVVGAVVMSTAPAVTAAGSMLFLGDAPSWRKIVAGGLAVAGVLILHLGRSETSGPGSEGERLVLGSLLVAGAVCCEAAYTLLGKKLSESVDPVLAAFLAAALSLPVFLPFALWQGAGFAPADVEPRAWAALVWYGAGTLALGTWLWYSGVRKTEGAVAAGFMGVMPASALILSYALLGEPFEWIHLLGFLVVLSGVLLISQEHAAQTRRAQAPERHAPSARS